MYKYNNVLLVDDTDMDIFISEQTMIRYFFAKTIHIKKDVESALLFLQQFSETTLDAFPDFIFIDLNLPLASGFDFLAAVKAEPPPLFRQRKPKLAVLTTSVYKSDEAAARAIFGDIVYIVKPLTKEALEAL